MAWHMNQGLGELKNSCWLNPLGNNVLLNKVLLDVMLNIRLGGTKPMKLVEPIGCLLLAL